MAGEKHIETSGLVTPGSVPDSSMKLSEKNMGQKNDSVYPSSGPKVNNGPLPPEQGAYYGPTSFYNYSGQGGMFGQVDDKGRYNASGVPYTPDSAPPLYYPHGYVYPTAFYDTTYSGNGSTTNYGSNPVVMSPSDSNTNTNLSNEASVLPYNSRFRHQWLNLTEPVYHNLAPNSLSTLGCGFQPTNPMKGYNPTSEFSSLAKRKPSLYMMYHPTNYYQSTGRTWNNNHYKQMTHQSFGRNNTEVKGLTELARGPRSERKNSLNKDSEQPSSGISRDAYNLLDFKIEYDQARFFVIKSFSEDDVQRSMKYNVWSSTPNGNKKLDASFHEAEAKANETSQKCPIFLFFSVNGSGQFVGVAEMIGKVDFTKNLDFWQLDKWSGFFPVKWHIIKDMPNKNLKHITLENNENKSVTHSRDTQEIGLKQGLEMLSIFKNYSEQASLLDDFNFYEKREKEFKAKRDGKTAPPSHANGFESDEHEKCIEAVSEGAILDEPAANTTDDSSTLVSLANLSLDS